MTYAIKNYKTKQTQEVERVKIENKEKDDKLDE